jgi:tetratricopeptide (TPR) repeat protein
MMRKIFFVSLAAFFSFSAFAQVSDYNSRYFNAKDLFRTGKYSLAMESFKPLIPYDQNNRFSEYAAFYYALSAYNLNYKSVARDMFNQLRTTHPKWEKIDEVHFWIARIHMDNKDYFQGLKTLSAITDKKMQTDIDNLKSTYIKQVNDVETLRMMMEEYPKDEIIAKSLAAALAKNIVDSEYKSQLEKLIDDFRLTKTDFIPEAPKTFFKEIYSISLVMPFMTSTLEPSLNRKNNQIVLDLYEGMKLAVDTLAKQGISLSLRAYDTERNVNKTKQILETEELKNTDIIIGPFFQEENKPVQDFSLANRTNVFNPFSNLSDINGTNPYAYLFQPSFETLGKKSADYVKDHVRRKNCMVFYGNTRVDSVLAANFIQRANENGIKISAIHKVNKDAGKIMGILATPTEYDEFKYPKQFTLPKDSLGSIFVASNDALIYAKVAGGVETRNDSVLVVGSEKWMEETAIDLERYQSLGIVLYAPSFTALYNPNYKAFVTKFIKVHGRVPSNSAKTGYELMLFVGKQLKQHGVYFQEGMSKAGVIPGHLTEGYKYEAARDNQLVPFIKFRYGQPVVVEKR